MGEEKKMYRIMPDICLMALMLFAYQTSHLSKTDVIDFSSKGLKAYSQYFQSKVRQLISVSRETFLHSVHFFV